MKASEASSTESVLRTPGVHRGAGQRETRATTGVGGSKLERQAARQLAAELEATGRAVQLTDLRVRAGQGLTVTLHAALAIAGGLIGLVSAIAGAAIVLATAFSFYGERGLGLFLASRILPRRRISNVISPPLGTAWEQEVDVILAAGYDVPPADPVGTWLERHLGGRVTTGRLIFWGGMIPLFAAVMMRVAGVAGLGIQLIQILTTAILLGAIAAQADRRLQGEPLGVDEDLLPARDLITAVGELDRANGNEDPAGVGICLFGAESDGAAGADAFYSDSGLKTKPGVTVIGLLAAAGTRVQATAREGDLTAVNMDFSLAESSPLKPERVTIRRDTAAGRASRRGVRAITLVGRGENGLDLLFDTIDAAMTEGKTE